MSTKTTFKRVALVAVAALGLGVLSVAPSSAAVGTSATVAVSANGTATTKVSDSSTAGAFSVVYFQGQTFDTVTVSAALKSAPTGAEAISPTLIWNESVTAQGSRAVTNAATVSNLVINDTVTAGTAIVLRTSDTSTSNKYVGGNFKLHMDTSTANNNTALTAGTYTFSVIVTPYDNGVVNLTNQKLVDVTYVVSATADASAVASAALSTAVLNGGSSSGTVTDSAVAAVSTANGTQVANIVVTLLNASGGNTARESITATLTGAGLISLNGSDVYGKSLVIKPVASATTILVRADGTAGIGTIAISTPSVNFGAKTVVFYSAAASTIAASANKPVIKAGTNEAVVYAQAKDSNGTAWGGAAYIVASTAADALIAGSATTPVACQYVAANDVHACPVSGTSPGTAKFKVIDAATVALATATSNEVSVRVSAGVPTTVKLAFDKATYSPGEKAQIQVLALDAAGLTLAEQTINNIFTTGGISVNTAFSQGSDTLTATLANVAGATSASAGTVVAHQVYTVYMPMSSGTVTISATGSTGLAAVGRVAVSASAEVVNTSVDAATDAALASADAADAATAAAQDASDAVAALSTRVSSLIKDLRKQIRDLTKLVQRLL